MIAKKIKGAIYRCLNDFDKTETYLRGLALNQTEFKIEIKDEELVEQLGILRIELDVSIEDDYGIELSGFYILQVRYYCSTRVIGLGIDTYYFQFNDLYEIHIVEVDKEHSQSKLAIFDNLDKYYFDIDMRDVDIKFQVAINLKRTDRQSLEHMNEIGLGNKELMFLYPWDDVLSNNPVYLIQYLYSHYKGSIRLFLYTDRIHNKKLVSMLHRLCYAVADVKRSLKKIDVELTLRSIDDVSWLYNKEIIDELVQVYKYFDSFELNTNNSLFLSKSL